MQGQTLVYKDQSKDIQLHHASSGAFRLAFKQVLCFKSWSNVAMNFLQMLWRNILIKKIVKFI